MANTSIMKKLLLLFMLLPVITAQAQQSMDYGLSMGLSSYLGDLKATTYHLDQNSLSGGAQGRYNFNDRFSLRAAFNFGTIKAEDDLTGMTKLMARNLSFRSRIQEFSLIGEANILRFGSHRMNKKGRNYYKFTPFVFGGLAVFHFNPEAKYQGKWYELQPLGTEGQYVPGSRVKDYNLTQISLPVGVGLKFQLEPNIVVSYEIGWRKTFTDYLDDVSGSYYDFDAIRAATGDIAATLAYRGDELNAGLPESAVAGSQRGESANDDWYIISSLTISYKFFRLPSGKFSSKF